MEALEQETQPIAPTPTKLTQLMEPSSYGCGVLVTGEDHEVQIHCSTEEPLSVVLWQRENCGCCSTRTSQDNTRGNEPLSVVLWQRENCGCCSTRTSQDNTRGNEPLSVALWQRENCGCCSTRTSQDNTRGNEPLSVALWQRENCGCCSTRTSQDNTRGNDDCTECMLVPEATRGNDSYCSRCGRAVVTVQMSWEADRSWSLRMLALLLQCARLRMLMAWCSTLGGAHSSLGEAFIMHAEKAGEISHKQLALASEMGDPRLASQCKLYAAFSLLQRGRLNRAAKIIREQYRFASSEATVVDQKVISMCLSAWIRLQHLRQAKKTASPKDVEIQEVS